MAKYLALTAVALAAACATTPSGRTDGGDAAAEITSGLHASAQAWNAGDLEGFLHDYLDSPETAFVSSSVVYGLDEIRRRYQASYWSTGRPAQLLAFDDIRVRPLDAQHALTYGRYILSNRESGVVEATGYFSLVLQRMPEGWRIIHDHSSSS